MADNNLILHIQRSSGITFQQVKRKYFKKWLICKQDSRLIEKLVTSFNNIVTDKSAHIVFHCRESSLELRTDLCSCCSSCIDSACPVVLHCHPHNILSFFIKLIIAELMRNINAYQKTGSQSDS